MATHSSILAWRIPGTGEPGGLPHVVLPSSQDEARARYSVSKDVPGSVLKCETVLGTLGATPKVPQHAGLTQGEHRGSRHHFI